MRLLVSLITFILVSTCLIAQEVVNPLIGDYYQISIEGSSPDETLIYYFTEDVMFIAEDLESPFFEIFKYELLSGDTMRLTSFIGGSCDTSLVGLYLYKLSGGELFFTTITDECEDRGEEEQYFTYKRMLITLPAISPDSSAYISFSNENGIEGLIDYESSVSTWNPPYRIYDVHGNRLQQGEIYYSSGQLNFSDFEEGNYYLSVLRPNGWETIRFTDFEFKISTSTTDLSPPVEINFQPNPSLDGIFQYTYKGNDLNANYRIYDSMGRFVKANHLSADGKIDLATNASTAYFIIVYDYNGATSFKLMK